jgi:hypothetical protein
MVKARKATGATVNRMRKKAPMEVSNAVVMAAKVGSSLKREKIAPPPALTPQESFDTPQASNTKIRSGFVTQPGELMSGGARRRKSQADKLKTLLNRKPTSRSVTNSDILRSIGFTRADRDLGAKINTADVYKTRIDNMHKTKRDAAYGANSTHNWGRKPASMNDGQWEDYKKELALGRSDSGFGKKRSKKKSHKKSHSRKH